MALSKSTAATLTVTFSRRTCEAKSKYHPPNNVPYWPNSGSRPVPIMTPAREVFPLIIQLPVAKSNRSHSKADSQAHGPYDQPNREDDESGTEFRERAEEWLIEKHGKLPAGYQHQAKSSDTFFRENEYIYTLLDRVLGNGKRVGSVRAHRAKS